MKRSKLSPLPPRSPLSEIELDDPRVKTPPAAGVKCHQEIVVTLKGGVCKKVRFVCFSHIVKVFKLWKILFGCVT